MKYITVVKRVNTESSHHKENFFSFFASFKLYLHVRWLMLLYYSNHFTIYGGQTIMLYTLILYSDVCQLYINKTGGKEIMSKSMRIRYRWIVVLFTRGLTALGNQLDMGEEEKKPSVRGDGSDRDWNGG